MIASIKTRSVALSAFLSVVLLLGTTVTAVAAPPGDDTVNIQYTLEGCREPGAYSAPPGLCADSEYTTGNLGKDWEELDFVPHRATLTAGSGQTTTATTFTLAADFEYGTAGGYKGYDKITEPTINSSKSDASCQLTSVGTEVVGPSLAGGVFSSKVRTITLSQAPSTTCVLDFYLRLAGPEQSSLYSGSSLHAYLLNPDLESAGIGEKRVPLPVNQVEPQELEVVASATQGSSHTWEVSKTATPDELDLPNTCPTNGRTTSTTTVRVEWDKSAATAGAITGSAIITATNPAHRDLQIRVQSEIKSGTSSLSPAQTFDSGFVTLPPGESTFTHTFTAPAGSTDLNAVVTGTYKDPITGEVLGSLQRNANADVTVTQETPANGTALIEDVESITAGYKFRVTDVDASSTAVETGGTFTPAYTPGSNATLVTGLTWSYTAGDDGWVEFDKVVVADGPTNSGATLSDTASVKTADGQTVLGSDTSDDSASVDITAATLAPITVNKTIPDIFDGSEGEGFDEVTFTFNLKTAAGNPVAGVDPITITFDNSSPDANSDGKLEGSASFAAVGPGSYKVHETAPSGWANKDPQDVTIDSSPAECSDSVTFENDNDKATAKVRKQTLPAGDGAGWTFILKKGEVEVDRETTTADGETGGYVTFSDGDGNPIELTEGSYTIEEVMNEGYAFQSSSTECSFTVDYPQSNGVTYDCTFVNKKLGSITVVKDTVDVSGDDQEFDFDLDPDNGDGTQSLSDGESHTFDGLAAATYTLSEDLPVTGWDLTNISCVLTGTETEKSFVENLEAGTAGIALGHGENVTCIYENTKEAKLIVEKQTDPAGSAETFVFTGDELPAAENERTLADNGTIEVDGLDAGPYTVSETAEDGWDLTDIDCDDSDSSGDVGEATATFELDAGEVVTCTFENTQRGSITVVKQTQPDGDETDFSFSGAAFGQDPFVLSDGEDESVDNLVAGTYTVTEASPEPGWKLASISCDGDVSDGEGGDNAASSGDISTGVATFELDPGEDVVCTYTNTKRGSITVVKQTIPDGDTDTFTFDLDDDGSDPISDGQSDTWGNLPDGTYTLSEDLFDDEWDLTDIDCGDATVDNLDLEAGSVDVTIGSNENGGANVTCTFENTKRGNIVVDKVTDPAGSEESFAFTGDVAGNLTDAGTPLSETNVLPGTYSVTETDEEGWELTDLTCDDGRSETPSTTEGATATFEVDPGETVTCTFENTQNGSIKIVKQTQPDGAEDDFSFTGEVLGQGVSLSDGEEHAVSDLTPGTYTVAESDPEPAWTLASINCLGDVSDGEEGDNSASGGDVESRTATFELDPGENLTCTFTNTKRGSITVVKQTVPDGDPATFTFDLEGQDGSTPVGDGQSFTWGNLADDTYTLSEDMLANDAWDLTDIDCGDTEVDENLQAGTVDVPIGSGENGGDNVTCVFTNTKRGSIIVEKQTNPDGAFGIFNFTGDAAGALTDGGQIRVDNLVPGEYTSTEADSSFSLSSIACDDGQSGSPSSGSVQSRTATFRVDPGETVKCVFTNDAPPPPPPPVVTDVAIDKTDSTDPVTAGQNFDYILTVTNNGPVVADNVTVSDTLPAGLGFVGVTTSKGECAGGTTITCSLGSMAVGESVTITVTVSTSLETPETVENTAVVSTTTNESDLTNNQDTEPTTIVTPAPPQATIIVQKETIPLTESTQTFEFVGDVTGNLGDGDTASAVVDAGTYTASEVLPEPGEESKWTLLSIECDDTDSTGDVGSLTATFVAEAGETVTCVFTNIEEEVLPTFIPPEEEPKPSGPEVLPKVVEPGVLPFTGGEPQNLVALAILLVLTGAGALLTVRIRRNEE